MGWRLRRTDPSRSNGCALTWRPTRATARSPTGTTPASAPGTSATTRSCARYGTRFTMTTRTSCSPGTTTTTSASRPRERRARVEPGRGIRSFVVGTGGKDLLALRPPKPGSEVLSNAAHGVLKLTLHGQAARTPRLVRVAVPERRDVREHVHRLRLRRLRRAAATGSGGDACHTGAEARSGRACAPALQRPPEPEALPRRPPRHRDRLQAVGGGHRHPPDRPQAQGALPPRRRASSARLRRGASG